MANKNSKIETDEYKMNVLNYIARYKQYITKEQYNYLYNKWKYNTNNHLDFLFQYNQLLYNSSLYFCKKEYI